jgi:hypothetical protein
MYQSLSWRRDAVLSDGTCPIAAGRQAHALGKGACVRTCSGIAPQFLAQRDPASHWYTNSPAPDLFHPIDLARQLR